MQCRAEVFHQARVRLARRQQADERLLGQGHAVIGRDAIAGRASGLRVLAHADAPSFASIQSTTGRHSVSRCREEKKPSCPVPLRARVGG